MQQPPFAEVSVEPYRTPPRRERFLDERNRAVPWAERVAALAPVDPKAEGPGRPPVGVDRMVRLPCLHQGFNLSDPAVEEALDDSRALRQFVGIDLGREPVPDETTIGTFRHLLETHQLGEQLCARIGADLAAQGLQVSRGTIVAATMIAAPSSTKNRQQERDPERQQTKKGNQWDFGRNAHSGMDRRTTLLHSVAATAATVQDSQVVPKLLPGQETRVWGDAAYSGPRNVIQQPAPCQELRPDQRASPSAPERGRAGEESDDIEGPCQSRTGVLGDQADLWVGHSSLPWAGEEYSRAVHQLRLRESVRGATAPGGGGLADVCANEVAGDLMAGNSHHDASKPAPSQTESPH